MSRGFEIRDYVKRLNYPRQSYGLSGMDWGDASEQRTRGKLNVVGPPAFISTFPPGATANDPTQWQLTYGASLDSTMMIFDGSTLNTNITSVAGNVSSPYRESLPTAENQNLLSKANGHQQIQLVVSKQNGDDFRTSDDFGGIDEARTIGMRAPMMMTGWGRTVGLRPTDPQPINPRVNDDLHKLDRTTWPTGPVDMPWDDNLKCWRGFNYLIADHESQNLGALVFSTNPNTVCGFPYLRGGLQQAWWVRRTDSNAATAPNDDTTLTGEVCTTLSHKLFDPNRLGASPLWDIFVCHLGDTVTCGTENTLIGNTANSPPEDGDSSRVPQGSLEIRCSTVYHWSDAIGTSIAFEPDFVGSIDTSDNLVGGAMGLVSGGVFGSTARWGPIVSATDVWNKPFDLCTKLQYRLHMSTLTKNSQRVTEDGVFTLENFICNWNEEYTKCILEHFEWVAKNAGQAIWALNFLVPLYIKNALIALATNITATVNAGFGAFGKAIEAAMAAYTVQIQSCFSQLEIACPLSFELVAPEIGTVGIEVDDFVVEGEGPPDCLIKSFASWEFENSKELQVTVVNPCVGSTDFTSSCGTTGAPGGDDVSLTPGESFGGTDADGDNNIGGTSFGDPSTEDGSPFDTEAPGSD